MGIKGYPLKLSKISERFAEILETFNGSPPLDAGRFRQREGGEVSWKYNCCPGKLKQFPKIINFLIDFFNNLCYTKGGKPHPTIAHSQQNNRLT